MPPRTITMATGPEGGAYHEVGKFYRTILARSGVDLRLRPTAGALENLALLRDPAFGRRRRADAGRHGARDGDADKIESLGTLFYEPLWLFYRAALHPLDIDGLRGLKVSVGPEGSGSRVVALDLLKRSGVEQRDRRTAVALTAGRRGEAAQRRDRCGDDADLLGLSRGQAAAGGRRTELASFQRADAYVALFPYLSKLIGAGRRRRPREEPAVDERHAGGAESQPRGAQGSQRRAPVPAARRRGADSFRARDFPARRPVPGRRSQSTFRSATRRCNSTNPAGRSCRTICRSGWRPGSAVSSSCSFRCSACSTR